VIDMAFCIFVLPLLVFGLTYRFAWQEGHKAALKESGELTWQDVAPPLSSLPSARIRIRLERMN